MSKLAIYTHRHSLVSAWIRGRDEHRFGWAAGFVFLGIILLALLSQIRIHLPFTPVPITGQTFGVMLLSLTWGALAPVTIASYLFAGFIGLPVFTGAAGGLVLGPSVGYLFGMFLASVVVGYFSDRGAANSFWKALGLCYLGSACVFLLGLPVLAHFVGWNSVLKLGLLPFIPGDFIKNVAAARLATLSSLRSPE